jgi:hypothetical protein
MTYDHIWIKFLRVANWSLLIMAISIFFIFDRTVLGEVVGYYVPRFLKKTIILLIRCLMTDVICPTISLKFYLRCRLNVFFTNTPSVSGRY